MLALPAYCACKIAFTAAGKPTKNHIAVFTVNWQVMRYGIKKKHVAIPRQDHGEYNVLDLNNYIGRKIYERPRDFYKHDK